MDSFTSKVLEERPEDPTPTENKSETEPKPETEAKPEATPEGSDAVAAGGAAEPPPAIECNIQVEIPKALPDPSKRRPSAIVSKDQAGCYLSYDNVHQKWVATWNPAYMPEAVAILTPTVKVPQFKYTKKERLVLEGEKKASRDVKLDYLMGLCSFFKLIRDFKGDLTLLPSAEELELKEMLLVGLYGNEIVRFDKFDHTYPYMELDCVALVPKSSMSFNGKQMEPAIFMGKGCREGYALSLKNRP